MIPFGWSFLIGRCPSLFSSVFGACSGTHNALAGCTRVEKTADEENMKLATIALAATFALSTTSLAVAKHRHHHHHHKHGMTTGMAPSGPSGPRTDGGGTDKSRAGGQGVSRKPAGE
jgi:hypothetical protein